jgi:hypothetical protein
LLPFLYSQFIQGGLCGCPQYLLLVAIAICPLSCGHLSREGIVAIPPICCCWFESSLVCSAIVCLRWDVISNTLPSVRLICHEILEAHLVVLLSEFAILLFEHWAILAPGGVSIDVAVHTLVFLLFVACFAVSGGMFYDAACFACLVDGLALHCKVLSILLALVTSGCLPYQSL